MKEFSLHQRIEIACADASPLGETSIMPNADRARPQQMMKRRDGIQQWTAFFVQHNMSSGVLDH
jgi:hypothetical protein